MNLTNHRHTHTQQISNNSSCHLLTIQREKKTIQRQKNISIFQKSVSRFWTRTRQQRECKWQRRGRRDLSMCSIHPGTLNGGWRVDFQLRQMHHRLPLTPVHEPTFGIDGYGTWMWDTQQHPPFGSVGQLRHADSSSSFIRPVDVATHPVDGQSLTRI